MHGVMGLNRVDTFGTYRFPSSSNAVVEVVDRKIIPIAGSAGFPHIVDPVLNGSIGSVYKLDETPLVLKTVPHVPAVSIMNTFRIFPLLAFLLLPLLILLVLACLCYSWGKNPRPGLRQTALMASTLGQMIDANSTAIGFVSLGAVGIGLWAA